MSVNKVDSEGTTTSAKNSSLSANNSVKIQPHDAKTNKAATYNNTSMVI